MKYEIAPCTDKDNDYIDNMICEYNLAKVPGDSRRVCRMVWQKNYHRGW